MSSFAGYCRDCGKPVMHKTLFGTLHLCLSPEEIQNKYAIKAQQQQINSKDNELLRSINMAAYPAHPNPEMER